MWRSLVYLLAFVHFILPATTAKTITVPLYKREIPSFYAASGQQLGDGLLAGEVSFGNPPQVMKLVFDTTSGYTWARGQRCRSQNCLDRCTFYTTRSKSIRNTELKHNVDYGNACVDTKVWRDTISFANVSIPHSYFGVANRMNGFDHGFDGYFGLGPAPDFESTKTYASASSSLHRRDTSAPPTFMNAAFQMGFISSPQFSIFVTADSGTPPASPGITTPVQPVAPPAQPQPQSPQPQIQAQPQPAALNATNTTTDATPAPAPAPASAPGSASQPLANPGSPYAASTGFTKRWDQQRQPYGQLIFGGIDQSKIDGDINYLRVSAPKKDEAKGWNVCIRQAHFGEKLKLPQHENAIASISSSSQFISMPKDQAECFHRKFNAVYDKSSGTYTIKCSDAQNLPPLTIEFDHFTAVLPPSLWTGVTDASRDCCHTKIQRGSSKDDWVLGTAFTHAFYSVFDSEKDAIGFGLLKDGASGATIIPK